MTNSSDIRMVQHLQINVIYNINKMKDKNYIIFSINAENTFVKIEHPFLITTLDKVDIEEMYLT